MHQIMYIYNYFSISEVIYDFSCILTLIDIGVCLVVNVILIKTGAFLYIMSF